MSAQLLIAELEQRNLLSDRQLAKLREAASQKQMSAKALAKFLVEKSLLSQPQATELLNSVLLSGGDLDVVGPRPEAPELGHVQLGITSDAIDEADDESSSIFGSYLVKPEVRTSQISSTEAEEFLLVPEEEPVEPEEAPRHTPRSNGREEAPILPDEQPAGLKQLAAKERGRPKIVTKSKRSKLDVDGKAKRTRTLKKKKAWDSPLILLGGGGLVLLLLTGGLVWWLLIRESADEKLTLARAAMNSGAYAQAIEQYEDFIQSAPRHPEHELAQVQIVLLRIRQTTEAGDFEEALHRALKQLKEIEDNEAFDEAHGELAALLPQIAMGLATQTGKASPGSSEAKNLAKLANDALELCNNVTYIPKKLRDEGKLTAVREELHLVEQRHQTKIALDDTLKTMQAALAAGDTSKSYAAYRKLLQNHRELVNDRALGEMLQKTTAAEQAAIRFNKEEQSAETKERPTAWVASLAVANRRLKPVSISAPAQNGTGVACVRIDGALYGLEAATGKLLWRRYVGFGPAWPQRVENSVIIADASYHELLCLDAATGDLVWRQSIGAPFAQPLILGTRAFVAAESGRLYALDLKSGARAGYVQFAQPLRVAPTFSNNHGSLYLCGDHSTVYSLSAETLACNGVFYLGHAPGSIAKSLAAVMDKLALAENDGAATSRLRLLSLGENGAIAGQVADRRLTGLPTAAPFVAGRRLVVITDRGQIEVYDVSEKGEAALTTVATRVATGNSPLVRHTALTKQNIWVGDTQLTKFSILPTGNRLPVEPIENDFVGSTFDHPLAQFGDTLVHVRRAKGRAGAIVAATSTAQGKTLWETVLAMPPAGAPVVDESAKSIAAANADGALFRFDEAAIRSRIQDEPLPAQAAPAQPPALSTSVGIGQGRAAFCAAGSDQLLFYNPALGQAAARWIKLDSPLACDVTPLGEFIVAPLSIGQVFLLSAADGSRLAAPFQTVLQPQKQWRFKPAAPVNAAAGQFVISDGEQKIYLVTMAGGAQPQLQAMAEADTGSQPIESPPVVLGDSAIAVAGSSNLMRFQLPSLEAAGEATLPAPVVWGPHRVGDMVLLANANDELMAIAADGKVTWRAPFEHGDLAGAPLAIGDTLLVAYRKGIVERRSFADGKPAATIKVEQPLAAGPVSFMQRLLLVANDGTLLVVDQP